jgi:hypothetical protein
MLNPLNLVNGMRLLLRLLVSGIPAIRRAFRRGHEKFLKRGLTELFEGPIHRIRNTG